MSQTLTVSGRTVLLDGPADAPVVVMCHGWPDSAALWDGTVAALSDPPAGAPAATPQPVRYRCVRFTWPGFAPGDPPGARTLDELVALLAAVVDAVSPHQPVTLLLHDWGCAFGYTYAARHPQRVARVAGLDIGDLRSTALRDGLTTKAKLMVAGYQLWLAAAWRIGGGLGDRMARSMARAMHVPAPQASIRAQMGYPYWITWTGGHGSYRGLANPPDDKPVFFAWGTRKPFMFHSQGWADALAQRPGCAALPLKCGHWLMLDKPQELHTALRAWLQG